MPYKHFKLIRKLRHDTVHVTLLGNKASYLYKAFDHIRYDKELIHAFLNTTDFL